ncbi:MAG: hypothetical protein ACRENK_09035 [Gemmatimonadaceae bacterium]
MKTICCLVAALIVSIMTGCTIIDGDSIVTGSTRTPISAEEVRLYRTAPEHFEEVAIVSASAGHDFKKASSLMNSAIQRLKEEAAKLGANGVLLSSIDERDAPSVTTSYGSATAVGNGSSVYATGNNTSVNRGDSYTHVKGLAIYVP